MKETKKKKHHKTNNKLLITPEFHPDPPIFLHLLNSTNFNRAIFLIQVDFKTKFVLTYLKKEVDTIIALHMNCINLLLNKRVEIEIHSLNYTKKINSI